VPVPVIRVDEAMADQAVKTGPRIGVIATLSTTLEPTAVCKTPRTGFIVWCPPAGCVSVI
jgi:hypothetical protein